LINALQHVNREKELVTTNERVVECLAKAKADRKLVVRYIQLIENDPSGEYIGTLIATAETVLTALGLYDHLSKPVDLDSDDEHIEQVKIAARGQGLTVPEPDGDTASIRSRLSAFDIKDREVDKLQDRQRARVANRARQGVHPDLQDLAFGPTAGSSSLQAPIQPQSRERAFVSGNLSDYSSSDGYSSGEDYPSHLGPPPTSDQSMGNARSYARYIQQDDEREGKGKGLLEEAGEDDPFADPFDDREEVAGSEMGTPAVERARMDWREV
jgi:hypothetical protein